MGSVVSVSSRFQNNQVALIKRMNPDCNETEFNQFMHVAASLGLDPLRKQIYAFVFNKDKPDRRRMSIIVGIDGFRSVAKRSGEYRPDDKPPRYSFDVDAVNADRNPIGIISAEVTVYQFAQNAWFPVTAIAYWDEFAPFKEGGTWEQSETTGKNYFKPNGQVALDPAKDNWRKMPRIMLAKCAEAQAIRRAWPEELSSIYADEEMDRTKTIDLTATEIANAADVERRLQQIGGADAILFDMGEGLTRIPLGKACDTIMAHLGRLRPFEVMQWQNSNRIPLQELWARSKTDALELKKHFEKMTKLADSEAVA